ncbi:glycolate oxidase iron-sulfur subunit [Luteitalea sp. TBR-22]|uniref:(Fe-S)-binding protein n=1 Tax=Luteitalea sp. TBR-22 TaxID=2802971 RepID=UPI001AF1A073|nr:heterodisulfide reductase-related iron-sulfur binding cluster [Luteitalea sp. TBR-22]BCS32469.1 glycolate oxidase iron-sulfur subunit [Luteitalea sp. TBR-22]
MQHRIPASPATPARASMAHAIETCVHCGFCLAACPTYQVLGEERDSPRGRIVLMKQVLEGDLALDEARPHVDRCLGCLACVTACPSGVPYGELLTPFRAAAGEQATSLVARVRRRVLLDTLESPARFRTAVRLGQFAQRAAPLLPAAVQPMLALLPTALPPAAPLPAHVPARGTRRARVALLAGCAQQVLSPGINHAALQVLAANGIEVVVPRGQGCCGALALHVGDDDRAYAHATTLARALPTDVDAIVTTAAGCGSAMKEYGHAFAGRDQALAVAACGSRVQDVAEFLDAVGLVAPMRATGASVVAYHDACHLSHAQGIRRAPRALLTQVEGLRLVEIPQGDLCCGSAGLYNVEQPELAAELGRRKADAIRSTGATIVTAGNIGCLVQIATHLQAGTPAIAVRHTVEILADALLGG